LIEPEAGRHGITGLFPVIVAVDTVITVKGILISLSSEGVCCSHERVLEEARALWRALDNTRRRLAFFVMVLAFSRRMYVEFTVSQTIEHFLACHEHGFAAWGGVPSKVMVDNPAVLQRLAGTAPVFNPRCHDFPRPRLYGRCRIAGGLRQEELPAWHRTN
jgi:hypothetical protein